MTRVPSMSISEVVDAVIDDSGSSAAVLFGATCNTAGDETRSRFKLTGVVIVSLLIGRFNLFALEAHFAHWSGPGSNVIKYSHISMAVHRVCI